ncbi:MAG: L-dopachrome tautomerase-related protein [Candidatus Binatia bacterium]
MRKVLFVFVLVVGGVALAIRYFFGGGERLEDRTGEPKYAFDGVVETVADLDLPPGNVAVSESGRVFFTFHPEGRPKVQLAELVDGKPVPYPDAAYQEDRFQTLLSLRIDRQNRLWALDYASYAVGQPRIFAFDLERNELAYSHDFPSEVAPFLSMLNDFQVDPEGKTIYIADTSIFGQSPAIIVHDLETQKSRRLLEGHDSVMPKRYIMNAAGRDMVFFGVVTLTIGVDSIALDKRGEWLYYAPVSDDRLYRIRAAALTDESLSAEAVAAQVEAFARKTLSDGISMDVDDNVYLTDMEHSAILSVGSDRKLETLVEDPRLRWPDGLSFGPDGWLYVTCSALHEVILKSADNVRRNAPYQIFRFRPGPRGVPGH